jgi:hypothetical protein
MELSIEVISGSAYVFTVGITTEQAAITAVTARHAMAIKILFVLIQK